MLSMILKIVLLCLIPIGIVFYTAFHPQGSRDIDVFWKAWCVTTGSSFKFGPFAKDF